MHPHPIPAPSHPPPAPPAHHSARINRAGPHGRIEDAAPGQFGRIQRPREEEAGEEPAAHPRVGGVGAGAHDPAGARHAEGVGVPTRLPAFEPSTGGCAGGGQRRGDAAAGGSGRRAEAEGRWCVGGGGATEKKLVPPGIQSTRGNY